MLVSRNRDWVEHARKLSTQAREPAPHYEHSEIGFNYRMSNLLAALGRAQLETLHERVAARRRIRDRYRELLDGVPGISFMPRGAVRDDERLAHVHRRRPGGVRGRPRGGPARARGRGHRGAAALEADAPAAGLRAAPSRSAGTSAARLFERGLCLPSGSSLTDEDQDRVVATVSLRQPQLERYAGAATVSTTSSQWLHCSLRPLTTSRYVLWISSVTSPTPISTSSTARTGVTSAAVPVMKTSSAR